MEDYHRLNEKKCPICNKVIRSDATLKVSCALCGMGVPEPDKAVQVETRDGTRLYFCCSRCRAIYEKDVV